MSDYLSSLFGLAGRVAVMTGGSSGIGAGMAEALARCGAQVVLVARTHGALADMTDRLAADGCRVGWVSGDLSDRSGVGRIADEAAAVFGEPDILVNCAGINLRPPLGSLTTADWDATMAVNLTAPFLLGQRFGPGMAERGWGRIVNVTSQQAHLALGNSGAYGASKGGLASLTRSQSEAWARSGVCCNSVCPGFVVTPLTAEASSDPARVAALAARTHMGRNGLPADFAGVAVFLASNASDYVTGQTVYVDGGFRVALCREGNGEDPQRFAPLAVRNRTTEFGHDARPIVIHATRREVDQQDPLSGDPCVTLAGGLLLRPLRVVLAGVDLGAHSGVGPPRVDHRDEPSVFIKYLRIELRFRQA